MQLNHGVTVSLSICTVSRKSENVARLLSSIETAGGPVSTEILVSWNGEGYPEFEPLEMGSKVTVFVNRPYNFASNNNSLARRARGQFLLFINDDVVLDPDAIYHLLKECTEHGDAMVGANLRYPDGRLQHAGVFFNDRAEPFHRYKGAIHYRHPAVMESRDVPAVTGACILLRRVDFEAVEGFDEGFSIAGEDINLSVAIQTQLKRRVRYCAEATAIHIENATRRETGQRLTPPADLLKIRAAAARLMSRDYPSDGIRVNVITEKPGWIMHRKAAELKSVMKNITINEDVREADIHYFINYGYYFRANPDIQRKGLLVGNFTHFDPDSLADQFETAAKNMDHCVSVSEQTTEVLLRMGVPAERITTIVVGADVSFTPALTLGIVGRVYKGGRKGEGLVHALLADQELMNGLRIVASNADWGVPVWNFEEPADFYRAIDYLLVPALIEGGPVPFMEALACGTLAIAPPIGVVPQFPHVPYRTGDIDSLKATIANLKQEHQMLKRKVAAPMADHNWLTWALQHKQLFEQLVGSA